MERTPPSADDVRMKGFARRTTVADALAWLDAHCAGLPEESVPVSEAAGRVLARDVTSGVDVPGFTRSMMDGFALRAADSLGASPYNRLALEVVGESLPGRAFEGRVEPGQAVRIMTGAPLPEGADAVLPAEVVEIQTGRILAQAAVSPGKHVGRAGEDVAAGTVILAAGRVLRPQDVGVLASIGAGEVPVVRRARVRIVVTGDELLPAGSVPQGHRIVDSNGPMLAALVARDGGVPFYPGIVPDQPEAILAAMRSLPSPTSERGAGDEGLPSPVRGRGVGGEGSPPGDSPQESLSQTDTDSATPHPQPLSRRRERGAASHPDPLSQRERAGATDLVLVSGGSSVGQEDHAPALLAAHGELAIHGIAMRPSSPTGMGLLDGRLVFLLPGNPVSCLCAYDFFAGRAIRALGGRAADWPYRRVTAPLGRKIVSTVGRLDYQRVRLVEGRVEPLAIGGASVLSSTTRADGFVLVPPDSEGYPPGAEVEVYLYD